MYKVYGDYRSGNCYKVKLMLHLLQQPYEWVPVNILRGETRSEDFLKKNCGFHGHLATHSMSI